jgi:hypothetical protein
VTIVLNIVPPKITGTNNNVVGALDAAPVQADIKSNGCVVCSVKSHGDIGEVSGVARKRTYTLNPLKVGDIFVCIIGFNPRVLQANVKADGM